MVVRAAGVERHSARSTRQCDPRHCRQNKLLV